MDDETRFEHLRAIPDEHIRLIVYDFNERLIELESDKRLRHLAISVALGAAPLIGVVLGAMSGVRISF